MIATISILMAAPDALYKIFERQDAHTHGERMVRTRPHSGYIDKSRTVRTIRIARIEEAQ